MIALFLGYLHCMETHRRWPANCPRNFRLFSRILFLPSPLGGEGLGVRGRNTQESNYIPSPHPQPLSPKGRGEKEDADNLGPRNDRLPHATGGPAHSENARASLIFVTYSCATSAPACDQVMVYHDMPNLIPGQVG